MCYFNIWMTKLHIVINKFINYIYKIILKYKHLLEFVIRIK